MKVAVKISKGESKLKSDVTRVLSWEILVPVMLFNWNGNAIYNEMDTRVTMVSHIRTHLHDAETPMTRDAPPPAEIQLYFRSTTSCDPYAVL